MKKRKPNAKRAAARRARPARKPRVAKPSSRCIPKRWEWHYRVLSALNDRLIGDTQRSLVAAAQPIEPHSMDLADSATDDFDHDRAIAELSAEQDALFEVQSALRRIEKGRYGICQDTGKPIPAARLRALPWTRFRKEAEERREEKGLTKSTRLTPVRSLREEPIEALLEREPTVEERPVVLPPQIRSILPS